MDIPGKGATRGQRQEDASREEGKEMPAQLRGRRALVGAASIGLAVIGLSACGSDAAPATSTTSVTSTVTASRGPATAAVEIPGADRFAPFVVTVAPNGTVSFHNTDTDEHTVTNLPGATVKFDLHVKANETKTLTLPAGSYRYYCTIHAKYIAETDQVAALPSAGFPDQPMEGVIEVS